MAEKNVERVVVVFYFFKYYCASLKLIGHRV